MLSLSLSLQWGALRFSLDLAGPASIHCSICSVEIVSRCFLNNNCEKKTFWAFRVCNSYGKKISKRTNVAFFLTELRWKEEGLSCIGTVQAENGNQISGMN